MSDIQERRNDDPRVNKLIEDVGAIKAEVVEMSAKVELNGVIIRDMHTSTAGVVQFLKDSEQAFILFNKTMAGLRWIIKRAVIPVAILVGGIWTITHDGHPPEWLKSWVDLFK